MNSFNLNIDDYSDKDIISLLSLNESYSVEDIEKSKEVLKYQILQNEEIDSEKKSNLILFLDTISDVLSNKLTNNYKLDLPLNSISKHSGNILINKKDKLNTFTNLINKRKIINIDSRFRKNYENTKSNNYDFELLEKENNVKNIYITDIDIPCTYNNISQENKNNTLVIEYTNNVAIKIVLPDGKYKEHNDNNVNMYSIQDIFNNKMYNIEYGKIENNNFTVDNNILYKEHYDIILTINNLTNKIKIKNNNNKIIKNLIFNIDYNGYYNNLVSHQSTLGWLLGFNKNNYNNSINTEYIPISERPCIISYPRYSYISINEYQTNYTGNVEMSLPYFLKLEGNIGLTKNIISKVSLINDLKFFDSINLPNQLNKKRSYYNPVDIQKLTIALYDEYGRYLDLTTDWSFSLILEYS